MLSCRSDIYKGLDGPRTGEYRRIRPTHTHWKTSALENGFWIFARGSVSEQGSPRDHDQSYGRVSHVLHLSGCPRMTLAFCCRSDFNPLEPFERNEFRSTKLFLDAR